MKTWAMLLFLLMVVAAVNRPRGNGEASLRRSSSRIPATAGKRQGCRLEVQDTISGRSTLLLPVSELDRPAFAACMRQRATYAATLIERTASRSPW